MRDLIKSAIHISANASNSLGVQVYTLSLDRAGGSLIQDIYGYFRFFLNNCILPILVINVAIYSFLAPQNIDLDFNYIQLFTNLRREDDLLMHG